jgi:hypothetical protein
MAYYEGGCTGCSQGACSMTKSELINMGVTINSDTQCSCRCALGKHRNPSAPALGMCDSIVLCDILRIDYS